MTSGDWLAVTAVATAVSSLAVAGGVLVAWRQLSSIRRSAQAAADSAQLQALVRVTDLVNFQAPLVLRARGWVFDNAAMLERANLGRLTRQQRRHVEEVWRAWDRVGLLVEHGLIEPEPLLEMWSHSIERTFLVLWRLLRERRHLPRANPMAMRHFHALYCRAKAYNRARAITVEVSLAPTDPPPCPPAATHTVYEASGGSGGLLRLAGAWHARVMADEVVSHAFSHGYHPEHVQRLAAYWAEALGGPARYSEECGDEASVVRAHSGTGPHDEMDRRAIACFDQALVDAGIAGDERLRQTLHDYFAWATTSTMSGREHSEGDVPEGLPIPRWSWDGLVRREPRPPASR